MSVVAAVALGSNQGDRRAHLDGAVLALRRNPDVRVIALSDWIETEPVGGPSGQGRYLNGVLELETTLAPRALLEVLRSIERDHGRVRAERNGPRTLDLDLLVHGDAVLEEPGLRLPHPRLAERRFVLEPWASIAPGRPLPGGLGTVAERLAALAGGDALAAD